MAGKKNDGQAFGVFERDGVQVVAASVDDAVRYRFDGWTEVAPAAKENQPEQPTE